jgi:hypothetical protein
MQGYLSSRPVPSEIFETRFLALPAPEPRIDTEDTDMTRQFDEWPL